MERQSIFKKISIMIAFVLCLGLFAAGVIFPVHSYADTAPTDPNATTYTVAFKIGGQLYDAYLLNYGQKATKPNADGLGSMTWNATSNNLPFDFTSTITRDVTLELVVPATKVAVMFLQENENYISSSNTDEYYNNKYKGLSVKIISGNTTISELAASEVPEKEGYTFKHWLNNESATTAFDFSTPISNTTFFYPKYELNEYTITFKHYNGTTETKTVRHGYTLSEVPEPLERTSFIANGWYLESDGTQTLFNFYSNTFSEPVTFLPSYSAADFQIGFASGYATYGNFGTYASRTFESFSSNQYVANGATFKCYAKLNSNYNQFILTSANISRVGSISTISVSPVSGTTDIYEISLIAVVSDVTIGFTGIDINKYSVTYDFTSAAGIYVEPHSSMVEGTNYTKSGDAYLINYNESFYFQLLIEDAYESKYTLNSALGAKKEAQGGYEFFSEGTVEWNTRNSTYKISNMTGNTTVILDIDTVACVTAVFNGIENLQLTGFDNPNFDSSLVKWDSSTSTARIQKGVSFLFGATTIDQDSYYILSFTGLSMIGSQYQYYANSNQDVTFNVVETIYVTIPASVNGATSVTGTSDISGASVDYNSAAGTWRYRVTKNGYLDIKFIFKTEYSDTDVSFSFDAGNPTVNKTDYATTQTVRIENIDTGCNITINPLQRNTYTIGLRSNDMADLAIADGYHTNVVEYGGNFAIKVTNKVAYSDAEVVADNVVITAKKYESFEVTQETDDEGISYYYLITITTIVGDFNVTIEGLEKNTYPVTMINNEFAEFSYSSTTAPYGGSYAFVYTLEAAYSNSTVKPENVKIIDAATSSEISTYTITVATAQRTITITGVITEIQVYITGLTKNTYDVMAEYFRGFTQFNCNRTTKQTVEHGSVFTFTLEFNNPYYTQSIDTIKVQYSINNGDYADLEPIDPENTKPSMTLNYRIPSITGKISFNVPALEVNRYTVIFYDTDPVSTIYQYNAVAHGSTITEPTRPTKEGYQCIGWFMSEHGTTQFNNFSSGITEDLTLYARYNAQTFTVTFHDGVGADRQYSISYGKPCPLPEITRKQGYSQAYWVTDGMNLNSVKEDYYVEAVYTIDVYTVRFVYSSEPETGVYDRVLETQSVTYNYKASAPASEPVIQGYTFNKWDFNYITTAITGNTDIHAEFTINTYKITFVNKTQGGNLVEYNIKYNTPMARLEPKEVEGIRGKYIFPYYNSSDTYIENGYASQLSNGYVLEGWYADADMSVRYNFADSIVKGNITIYGNMYVSKVSVKFYVDNEFYIEKLVEYETTLTDIPDIPVKPGYTQTAPEWTIVYPTNGSFEDVTNDIRVEAVYTLNKYYVTFKLPSGDSIVREIAHGGTVTNVPYPDTDFGEVVVIDTSLLQYVTSNTVVYITIIDFLPFMVVAGAACVLTFVVVSLVIAIKNMRRGIKNIKRMEELFSAIKKQDARLTQVNEAKLKAEIEMKMKEKEKYKRGSFLDD